MAVASSSSEILSSQRPRFVVGSEPVPQLDSDLLSLEVRHDEDGLSSLEARFNNRGDERDGGGTGDRWLDGSVLILGTPIRVAAGEADNEALIFSGAITALTGRWTATHGPEVRIFAEDAAMLLRMGQTSHTFDNATDADIAREIAERNALTSADDEANAEPVEGTSHVQLWQVNESDLSVLRERARAVDARIEVAESKLGFLPRRPSRPAEAIALSTEGNLLTFEATVDLAHQRTEVQVHGWSVASKRAIHVTAGSDAVSAESAGGRTGPEVLSELGWNAIESRHLEVPATEQEARDLAEGLMRRRSRRFVRARGMTDGTPGLRVGSRIDVADASPMFSGFWTVASVRHRFDHRGLRTYFVAERTDLGGRG